MSRVLGIISEYNPFHNGHLYHLNEAKKISNAEYTVCVMSGNFVQRGNTSIIDKWSKAKMAILNGVDLVIELPVIYSISSAETFAYGAIKILDNLNIVDCLCFGSELGDIDTLNVFADILLNEPPEYISLFKHELQKGVSYPKAKENALLMYLKDIRRYANILSGSNNTLGVEYLKNLRKLKSNIEPFTIKRKDADYNSTDLKSSFVSATAIRKNIKNLDLIREHMPESSFEILEELSKKGYLVPNICSFEKEIIYRLRTMTLSEINDLPDVTEGLENALKSAVNSCNNMIDLINAVKCKRYTQARIQRILLYALLNITKREYKEANKVAPYIRVLGVNNNGKKLLSEISSKNSNLEIITSVKTFFEKNNNRIQKNILSKDILATNIYTLGYKYDSMSNLDYTTKLLTL